MKQTYDVVALGELLIDFTENGTSLQGNPLLEANPGGAPCNVLAMLSKWGKKTAFIGKVGKDQFGTQLEHTLKEVGIETKGLVKDENVHTTLAFVHTHSDGDREFSFYRNPGADCMLSEKELDEEMLQNTKIFHFGSLSMTHDICRKATQKAVELVKSSGAILSFDPNLREALWPDLDTAKQWISYGMQQCDVLKISDNEIQWFTGKKDFDEGIHDLQTDFPNLKLILLSMGKIGSRAYLGELCVEAAAFTQEKTIETTGAGDTFCGNVLRYILEHGLSLTREELQEMLTTANAAASIITTRKGALRVMPSCEEIKNFIADYQK